MESQTGLGRSGGSRCASGGRIKYRAEAPAWDPDLVGGKGHSSHSAYGSDDGSGLCGEPTEKCSLTHLGLPVEVKMVADCPMVDEEAALRMMDLMEKKSEVLN